MSDNDNATSSNPYAAPEGNLSTAPGTGAGTLASRWARLGAAIIDGIIMMVVSVVPMIMFFGGWAGYVERAAASGFLWKLSVGIFGLAVFLLINGYFLAQSAQSLGKKAVGIKIMRTDGTQPPLSHILLRRMVPVTAAQLIPFVGPLLVLIDTLLIFRSTRQCIHDQIADTVVVNA
jgi:uncharacterized RDD family membrane protein YckC